MSVVDAPAPTRRRLLAVLALVQLVTVLDNTILNVAVPSLSADLDTGTSGVQWVIGVYSLVQAGCLLSAGAAADRYGRKRLLQLGLWVFGGASVAAALSQSTHQLVLSRAVMGLGGALIGTATLAVALQVFHGAERTRAIGIWASVSALGFAVGPPLGGLLLARFSWQAVFVLNLPVVLVGLLGVRALVEESRGGGAGPPDLVGALLSTVGVTAIAAAVIAVPDQGVGTPHVLGLAAVALAALATFVRWELTCRHPMLDLALLRDARLVGALSGIVLITFGCAGVLLLLSLQLQVLRGYAPGEAGVRLAPFALTIVLVTLSGRPAQWLAVRGAPLVIATGMTTVGVGTAVVAASNGRPYGVLLCGLVLMGAGCAVANPALIEAVLSAIPPERAGTGAGLDGMTAELGAGLGVAVLGAVLQARSGASPLDAGRDALAAGLVAAQLLGALAVVLGGALSAWLLSRAARPTRLGTPGALR